MPSGAKAPEPLDRPWARSFRKGLDAEQQEWSDPSKAVQP